MMARSKVREEKIFVTVRVRPLNGKEVAQGETADWVCLNEHTVVFKPTSGERERPAERSALPSSYVFDRVFGPECATQRVYEDGAKDVSLSALTGLNSTIFAYGQTSSGKTYTMRGIMECAVRDIYEYIRRKEDREFVLKVSAMEIYNEAVRDLLHPEAGSGGGQGLKLLDDPEKGTIVEKIVEEVIQDMDHLRRILAVCEAQRQVGQTSLNDTSSRSHQIIRVSVESFARAGPGEVAPSAAALVASLNFVDLAGSERASQTQAEGARLKEGTYINRSLLTLGTVIRKLSGGNSGHIPYRDSKLTRILQNSLGGNARTAIICTMSPAHSHAEQTRNTLSFATRAKEVTNKAEVNVVISDKLLVKQLQREVARLEAERRTPELAAVSMSTEALLLSKDLEIERMDIELKELQRQRDAARGELEEAKRRMEEDERMAHELKQLQQQRDAARGELEVVKRRLEEDERMALELKELQRQRDAAKGELEEVKRRLEEDERMAEEVTKLQRQRDAAQAELEEVKRRLEGDERRVLELEELQRQRDAAQAELKAVSRRVEGAERRVLELEELQRQRDAAQAELEQVRRRLENDERRVLELQRQRDAAQGELEEVKRKVEGGERMVLELIELKRQRDAAQGELEEVRRRMEGELDAVQAELEEVKMKMGGELDEVRSRLEGELDEVRRRLEGELEEVKKKLAEEQEAKKAVQPSEDPVPQADQQLSPQGHVTLADHLSIRQPGLSVRRSESALMLAQEIHKLEHLQDELGEDAGRALEALQKEVECLRLAQSGMNEDAAAAISKLRSEIQSMHSLRTNPSRSEQGSSTLAVTPVSMRKSMQQELSRLQALGEEKYNTEATIATLEAQLENVQISLDKLLMESVPASPVASEEASPAAPSSGTPVKKKKTMPFGVSGNIRYRLLAGSPPCSPGSPGTRRSENNENVPPPSPRTPSNNTRSQGKEGDASKETQKKKNSVDVRKMQNLFKTAAEENIKSIRAYVSELKERVSKLQYQKQLLMCQVLELEANKSVPGEVSPHQQEEEGAVQLLQPAPSPQTLPWHAQYEVQRNLIIELWHICQVSIIHRTQFYLLFRGDPADAIYMEVELRRLTWLHENGSDPCIMNSPNPSFSPSPIKSLFQDEQGTPLSASARSLRRERELLARRMRTRLTMEEKEELYFRWDVPVDSKQRRLQLAQRLWTSCDLDHVQASAEVVARIVGFWEPGNLPSKEMFELNLTHPNQQRQWIVNGLNSLSNLLNL